MTRLYQLIVAACAVAIASGSCGAPPPVVRLTPVQVPSVPAIQADGQDYVIFNFNGSSYLFVKTASGTSPLPATVVNVSGPTPPPLPPNPPPLPPPSPLTARQILLRDAALKANADPARFATAQKLAAGYTGIYGTMYDTVESLAVAVHGINEATMPNDFAKSWQPFRDALTTEFNAQAKVGLPACYQVIQDASKGLTASITP